MFRCVVDTKITRLLDVLTKGIIDAIEWEGDRRKLSRYEV